MSWSRLDDGYWSDPDLEPVSLAALGVFSRSLSYCGCHNTDGHVPGSTALFLARGQKKLLKELVDAALWEEEGADYKVRSFLAYNPSRAEVEAKRKADAERKRKARESQ